MFIAFVHFLANLLLAGLLLRMIEMQWPESAVGKALLVVY